MLPSTITRLPRFRGARSPIRPTRWSFALGGVLLVSFTLRVWGIRHGLPLIYNPDEQLHFVPKAVEFFQSGYNPNYYFNPPGFTYLLHLVFASWFGGRDGVLEAWSSRSSDVFLVGRYTSAALGTLAVLLTYLTARRLFDRKYGLLSAALLAVAFLPVFFAHQAVNDGPQLAPIALSLFGSARIFTSGKRVDYLIAGTGLGLACGTKYPAGIVIVPLLAAALSHLGKPQARRCILVGLSLSGLAAIVAFAVAVPGIVFDTGGVLRDLSNLSGPSGGEPKLGQAEESGIRYYLWTLTWGLGWIPSLSALLAAVDLTLRNRRLALLFVPAPVIFILFMGTQERYFGRYLLPLFPLMCILASYGILRLSRGLSKFAPRLAPVFAVVAAIALPIEGLVHSIHTDLVLSREDTRALTREWMVANIPSDALIMRDPVMPSEWLVDPGPSLARSHSRTELLPQRWHEVPLRRVLRDLVDSGALPASYLPRGRVPKKVSSSRYVTYLQPQLIDEYIRLGICWIVAGSSQWGRVFAQPEKAPRAVAYYRVLARRGRVVYSALPYEHSQDPGEFNFDWSSDYYPLHYDRPGPELIVYRLSGGRC
jgi:hypothetical protein